jgi:predicted PurR-regulated permease PerM
MTDDQKAGVPPTSGHDAGDQDAAPLVTASPSGDRMPRWIYRLVGLLALAALLTLLLLSFFKQLTGFFGTIVLSLFVAFALEPGVNWLARHGWRRGLATFVIMFGVAVVFAVMVVLMAPLLVKELKALIASIPQWVAQIDPLLQKWFGVSISQGSALLESDKLLSALTKWGAGIAGNVFGLAVSFVGMVFQLFTLALFAFYFIADGPRMRRALLSVLRPTHQREALNIWEVAVDKTGGYLYSRILLAALSGTCTFVVLTILRIPFALPLAVWMGLVSQFIPTVGTYIAAAIPLLVTVLESPWKALVLLAFIVVYQQIENYLFAPRVTAHTMEMHPAVAFGSVIVGAALFGAVGAFLAIPAAAILQALVWTSVSRFEVVNDELTMDRPAPKGGRDRDGGSQGGGVRRWLRLRRKEAEASPTGRE